MPKTAQEYSQQIQAQLKTLIPDLSLDPLTPERKIVDTLSEVLAEGSIDPYLLNYQFDIDTKVGSDLDKFVALFGFARQAGRRATGTITFSRVAPASSDILIPTGTTVQKPATSVSGTVVFVTTTSVVLAAGAVSVDAPIQAADEGLLGNVPAGSITQLVGGATSVSAISNTDATTGGAAIETDAELRVRFKNTIFRNVAGTQDQFLALAIATQFSNKANVIGPISRYYEYVQIPPSLSFASTIPYSKYTYPFDYYLTDGNIGSETFYISGGIDYTLTTSVPPVVTVNNTTNLPVGGVFLLEHSYCSTNSRNDPTNNIANYVDVFVSGADATTATETAAFPSTTFSASSSSPYYNFKFVRTGDNSNPVVGNKFQQFVWQPVYDVPSVITINGVDYYEGTHYWQVRDATSFGRSKRARDGIEWASSVSISTGTTFTFSYTFNKLPIVLNELMDRYKQITSDVLVHTANLRYFIINLIVMYSPGFVKASVDEAITAALTSYMERQTFGAVIQISDLLQIAHEVPGVDNVRLATASDGIAYGVQEVASDQVTLLGPPYTNDFALQDSDLPVLNLVVTTQKSQNTW